MIRPAPIVHWLPGEKESKNNRREVKKDDRVARQEQVENGQRGPLLRRLPHLRRGQLVLGSAAGQAAVGQNSGRQRQVRLARSRAESS